MKTSTLFLGLTALVAATASFHPGHAFAMTGSDNKADVDLVATGVVPDASGRAKLRLRSADEGRFEFRARGLTPGAAYELLFSEVPVGSVTADEDGRARLRFRSRPRTATDGLLGFDPRGSILVVRDVSGADVLAGDVPAGGNGSDDTRIVCCVPDDDEIECEDRTPDECVAEGGTVSSALTCLPNPCDTTTPPAEDDVVCCLPDDSGPECEDRTVAECSAGGGIVVDAASCLENPCAGIPPLDDDTRCCEPDDSGNQCEDRLPSECAARGGVDIGAGICAVDSCADVAIPTGNEVLDVRCEKRSSRSRASVDASGVRTGTYTARIVSGANEAASGPLASIGDEVGFDFDSDGGDIAMGATPIPSTFFSGSAPSVTAQLIDANGNVVIEATAACTVN